MDVDRLLDGRLKIRHLVLVTAIAEQGSVARAAERLRVTQPVVTRGLRELESVLGVELFERGPRGVTPTIYGVAFVDHSRMVLAEIRQAGRHVAELGSGEVGTVVVGNHLSGANLLLPKAIAAVKRRLPHLTVVVRDATPDVLSRELLAGDVDMVIGRLTPVDDGRTTRIRLYNEPVRLVVRAGHPAAELTEPRLVDLLDHAWVLPVAQTTLRHEIEQVFLHEGLPLPRNRVECTSILTLRTLLAESDVIAALPYLIARDDNGLVTLPTPLPGVHQLVGVTVASDRPASPGADQLLQHLKTVGADIRRTLTPRSGPERAA